MLQLLQVLESDLVELLRWVGTQKPQAGCYKRERQKEVAWSY
jgi:hypothetical protein